MVSLKRFLRFKRKPVMKKTCGTYYTMVCIIRCSTEFHNESLNKHFLRGPDFTNNLVGGLCRIRKKPVALIGDIEGMFH